MAHLIDVILAFFLAGCWQQCLRLLLQSSLPATAALLGQVVGLFTLLAYFFFLEALWNGQTFGKKLMRLRVRSVDGTPVTFFAALGRNFLRIADLMPGIYLFGLLSMFLTKKSQRIGDLVANTVVTYEPTHLPRFRPAPHAAGVHAMERYVGELPGMTQDEYLAVKRLCDRFPEFPTALQERMIREIWQPIALRRNVPFLPNVHPIYLAEAAVMKYGRQHGLL